MTSLGMMGARLGFGLLGAAAFLSPAPAAAQVAGERADDALSRNLRLLASNPKSLAALMGAGKAAIELGDPQAALTFFARAEEVAPRDGRIKLWIGSALVQLQQPRAAMRFFKEAVDLGVADGEVAADRGLAHDISGNPREAQRDYRLALQRGRNAEVTRRLALSLAITGQREAALQLLEEQLLMRDPAAERARAFVLALVGDTSGAARAVGASMPGGQGEAMAGFLRRLPQLGQTERALAVHLGVFPTDGRSAPTSSWASSTATDAGRPDPSQVSLARRTPVPEPVSTAPRRRPGTEEAASKPALPQIAVRRSDPAPTASRPAAGTSTQPARSTATKSPAASTPAKSPASPGSASKAPPPSALAYARGSLTVAANERTEAKPATPVPSTSAPKQEASSPPGSVAAVPGFSIVAEAAAPTTAPVQPSSEPTAAPSELASVVAETAPPPSPEPVAAGTAPASRLASLAATLETIAEPEPEAPKAAPTKTASPAKSASTPKAKTPTPAIAAAKKPAAPAEPSRHWVQVAGGANKAALPGEYARLKAKAPKLLGARAAWITPANATNRLLVGPFASAKEAQAFVNSLAEEKLSAFAWQSAAGQKIEKLPAR